MPFKPTYSEEMRAFGIKRLLERAQDYDQEERSRVSRDRSNLPRQGAWAPEAPSDEPGEKYPTAEVHVNNKKLRVRVADTPALRKVGLQNRPDAGASEGFDGLLFRWPQDAQATMHNAFVNFPVSCAWFDSNSTYVDHAHMLANDATPKTPKGSHRYALEVHSKDWDSLGIGPGTQISIADAKDTTKSGTVA